MGGKRVYLDTSAIVKRYVEEEHSDVVDEIYDGAHAGRIEIGFSLWNIGEVAAVLSKYARRGVLEDPKAVFERFVGESRLLSRLGQAEVVPITYGLMSSAVGYVLKHSMYIADALQMASAENFDEFLTFDEELARVARSEGLKVVARAKT